MLIFIHFVVETRLVDHCDYVCTHNHSHTRLGFEIVDQLMLQVTLIVVFDCVVFGCEKACCIYSLLPNLISVTVCKENH